MQFSTLTLLVTALLPLSTFAVPSPLTEVSGWARSEARAVGDKLYVRGDDGTDVPVCPVCVSCKGGGDPCKKGLCEILVPCL